MLEYQRSLVLAPDIETRRLVMREAVAAGATSLTHWPWWLYAPGPHGTGIVGLAAASTSTRPQREW